MRLCRLKISLIFSSQFGFQTFSTKYKLVVTELLCFVKTSKVYLNLVSLENFVIIIPWHPFQFRHLNCAVAIVFCPSVDLKIKISLDLNARRIIKFLYHIWRFQNSLFSQIKITLRFLKFVQFEYWLIHSLVECSTSRAQARYKNAAALFKRYSCQNGSFIFAGFIFVDSAFAFLEENFNSAIKNSNITVSN